jgi:uncharacterized protein
MVLFYRFIFFIIGLIILTFGVCLTIKADLGAGAWDALNVGLTNMVGLTIGKWVMIVGGILMFVNAILLKKRPEVLSIFTIVLIGLLIDLWMGTIMGNLNLEGFPIRLGTLLIGLLIIGFGAAIYLQASFPLNPLDNLMMAIKHRFGVNLMAAKTIGELIGFLFALIVKGPIGFGTLIVTFAIGPFIQVFYPFFEKLFRKCTEIHRN